MRRRSRQTTVGHAAAVLAVLTGCMVGSSAAADTARPPQAPHSTHAAPVTAVVTLASDAAVGGPGVRVLSHLRGIGSEVVRGTPAALEQLRRNPEVTGFRLDGRVTPTAASVAAINESGSGVYAWQGLGARAGLLDAGWDVTVALVDTGISDTPALNRASGRLVDGVDTSGLVDGSDDPAQPVDGQPDGGLVRTEGAFTDGFGHGTFLANLLAGGITAPGDGTDSPTPATTAGGLTEAGETGSLADAVSSSGRPAAHGLGVAPGARVVSVKVADDSGMTSLAAVLAGLDWVATHRPMDVVALALAAERPGDAYGADPLTAAVRHLRSAGLTVIVAAGNTAGEVSDPGFDPQALTVGAADTTGPSPEVAPFSGSGMVHGIRKPDLVAPGVRVLSVLPSGSYLARNNPQARVAGGLWRGSGSSQATAVAAGVAAIYLALHPTAGPAAVKSMLRGAAAPMPVWRAGTGLLTVPGETDKADFRGGTLDEAAWAAGSWDAPGWVEALDASWSTDVWTAKSWSSNPWSEAWSAKSWSAKSWSAKSWSAKSWSAKSWSAKSWSAKSWSAYGWFTGPVAR